MTERAGNESDAQEDRKAPGLVWTQPVKEKRREPLTRNRIVAAAVELADSAGIEAVSIRRVAAVLDVRPMGLYSHIARKGDLVDLMVDEVVGETLLVEIPSEWRDALSALANATRSVCLAHPWLLSAAGLRPQVGPNAIRHVEQSLAAVASFDVDQATRMAVLRAVDTFALGQAQISLAVQQSQQRDDLSADELASSTAAYLRDLVSSGEFPHLAALGIETVMSGDSDEEDAAAFEVGLRWLLNGIAAQVDPGLADKKHPA